MKLIVRAAVVVSVCIIMTGCEGCVRKAAQKVTELGLSAVEGVADAVEDRGEETARRMTDALGRVAVGALKSIDEQLQEHAEYVLADPDRTVVTGTAENVDMAAVLDYYDPIAHVEDLAAGVSVSFLGKMKGEPVVDAVLSMPESGTYTCTFTDMKEDNSVLFVDEVVMEA